MRVIKQTAKERFARLQERFGDSLLTALTIVLAFMMFVIAPLHAADIIVTQGVGFTLAMFLIAGVFIPVVAMLAAFALATTAGILRACSRSRRSTSISTRPRGPSFASRLSG
jgi:hypothetical protein